MLYLVTGLPGAGKTLYTVSWIPGEFKDKNGKAREVYYSGIKDLKLPWHELAKPEDWPNVPDGSVVVLDEAQRCMRVRAPGQKVPDHVQLLETHRHRGLDVVIITQHPNLLDTNVRRLVGRHTHVRRTWGMGTAKLYAWDKVGDPESNTELAEAQATRWQYNKASYALYHSSEVHTHKVRLPKRVAFAVFLLLVLIGLIWYTASWMKKKTDPAGAAGAIATGSTTAKESSKKTAPVTYQEWSEERRAVAPEDMASSARYFPLTQAVRAPRVAGCIRSAERCQCFTQQATIVKTSELQCAEILANLRFQDWGPGGDSGWSNDDEMRRRELDRKEGAESRTVGARPAVPAVQTSAPVGGTQVPPGPR